MINENLKTFLDEKVEVYNSPSFITDDPICIPRSFTKKQDIEIAGFIAAMLAWGQRKTIINKCRELMQLMQGTPHDFVLHASEEDLKPLVGFKHRTFNTTDTLYFVEALRFIYRSYDSMEEAFTKGKPYTEKNIKRALETFYDTFFSLPDFPMRTRKHLQDPRRKSACKRINMFLRWMVRKDDKGVDFGIWQNLRPDQLICPCDLHVDRVARKLGLITRKNTDWQTAVELTDSLKQMDADDPVKYDFALFGLGIERWV